MQMTRCRPSRLKLKLPALKHGVSRRAESHPVAAPRRLKPHTRNRIHLTFNVIRQSDIAR